MTPRSPTSVARDCARRDRAARAARCSATSAVGAAAACAQLAFFRVRRVEIVGARYRRAERHSRAAARRHDWRRCGIRLGRSSARVATHPQVRTCRVTSQASRERSSSNVVENMPVALVPTPTGFLVLRRARARVADRSESRRRSTLPVLLRRDTALLRLLARDARERCRASVRSCERRRRAWATTSCCLQLEDAAGARHAGRDARTVSPRSTPSKPISPGDRPASPSSIFATATR